MDNCEALLKLLLEAVNSNTNTSVDCNSGASDIPVGVSNRHVHLSQEDVDALFGKGYQLTKIKDLSQPGQFACKEVVIIAAPKGAIEKVRVLGPVRSKSQVEILASDCFKLGVASCVRQSGDLAGTPGITIVGPKGSVYNDEGVIIALRHIHMTPEDAQRLGVTDGQIVKIKVGGVRGGVYDNVVIRANNTSALECHVDIEEANAMCIDASTKLTIVK